MVSISRNFKQACRRKSRDTERGKTWGGKKNNQKAKKKDAVPEVREGFSIRGEPKKLKSGWEFWSGPRWREEIDRENKRKEKGSLGPKGKKKMNRAKRKKGKAEIGANGPGENG